MSIPTPDSHPPKAKGATDQPADGIPQYARVVGMAYLGVQPEWEWAGKKNAPEEQFEITYELPNSKMEDGRPHWLSEQVSINFNDGGENPQFKSKLMRRVTALCPNGEADNGYNLNAFINQICMVTPQHNKKGYAKIGPSAVAGVPVGTAVPELENQTFNLLDWDTVTKAQWGSLPSPLTKKKIQGADNYPTSKLKAVIEGTLPDLDEDVPF